MSNECIRVVVRCRPLSNKEINENSTKIVSINEKERTVEIICPDTYKAINGEERVTKNKFTFDAVFDENSTQDQVFSDCIEPLVSSALGGFNVTVFAYGQTGSGKTFTMSGTEDKPGVLPHAFKRIFELISENEAKAAKNGTEIQYLVRVSFLELFKEDIRDLLYDHPPPGLTNVSAEVIGLEKINPKNLVMKLNKHGNYVVNGLQQYSAKSAKDLELILTIGNSQRAVASTLMNETSSRSHSVFTITVESSETIDGKNVIRVGKFNLVDLAGSEKQKKTETSGEQLKIAIKINQSLSTLNKVITALVKGEKFIPFRESVLTHLLQDSLGGNTKTLMIAALSPASSNYDETLGTLKYADRAKQIKNKPKVNEDPKDAQIREMRDKIKELEEKLKTLEKGYDPNSQPVVQYEYEYEYQYTEGPEGQDGQNGPGETGNGNALLQNGVATENGKRSKSSSRNDKKAKNPHKKTRKRKGRKHDENGANIIVSTKTVKTEDVSSKIEVSAEADVQEEEVAGLGDEVDPNDITESIKKASEIAKDHDASRDAAKQTILELKEQHKFYASQLVVKPEQWKVMSEKMEQELAEAIKLLNQQKEREKDLKIKLEIDKRKDRKETSKLESQQALSENLEKEVEDLKKKVLELRQTMQIVKEKQAEEKDEIQAGLTEITRKQQKKAFLIDLFVPPEEEKKIRNMAIWDEDNSCWKKRKLDPREKILQSLSIQAAYPVFESNPKVAAVRNALLNPGPEGINTRYLTRNVMALCVDLPENGLIINDFLSNEEYDEQQNDMYPYN